jgi:hypothetical protein
MSPKARTSLPFYEPARKLGQCADDQSTREVKAEPRRRRHTSFTEFNSTIISNSVVYISTIYIGQEAVAVAWLNGQGVV